MKTKAICTILFSLLLAAASAQAGSFSLGYGGRLSNSSDEAEKGPVDLEIGFYKSATGTDVITVVPKTNVQLDDGVFQLDLGLTATERANIFGDGSSAVWVEVVDKTHKKAYPRQMLTAVPYAIAAQTVPVDGTTVSFDANGKLKANITSPTGQDMVTAINSSSGTVAAARLAAAAGDVTGSLGATTVGKIQGRAVATTAPSSGQVLTWTTAGGGSWEPNNPAGTGTVTQVIAGAGLSGGPITSSGTIAIAAAGVTDAMLASGAASSNTASALVKRDSSGNFVAGTITANLTGNVTGNVTGSVSGTAASFTGNLAGDVSGAQGSTAIGASKVTSAHILDGEIVNADISSGAAIAATKVGGGLVSNVEFDYLDGVTSSLQTQLDGKLATGPFTISGGNVGLGTKAPLNPLSVGPIQYSAGTASQSGSTVTGSGTTWTSSMVGSQLVFSNGTSAGIINAFGSVTSLTVSTSQTVASQTYKINYPGLQVGSTGNVGIGTTTPTSLLELRTPDQAAGNYALKIVGTLYQSLSVNNQGNVGIGAAPTGNTLTLGGPIFMSSVGSNLAFENSSGSARGLIGTVSGSPDTWAIGSSTGSSITFANSAIVWKTTGDIGVGMTSPAARLDVRGADTSASSFALKLSNSTGTPLFRVANDGMTTISGPLTVEPISAPSVSPATNGRIYFDSTSNKFQVSENGGAYKPLTGGNVIGGCDGLGHGWGSLNNANCGTATCLSLGSIPATAPAPSGNCSPALWQGTFSTFPLQYSDSGCSSPATGNSFSNFVNAFPAGICVGN